MVTVFAARIELRVVQRTVTNDRMERMRSRRHSGQFCSVISCLFPRISHCDIVLGAYQWIIGIITWLWNEDNWLVARPVAFEA
jgi:hypothetical protein